MIGEDALERACRPAILGRARIIARREGRIWDRACSYEGRLTHLSARVDSASGYADSYEASITVDEAADEVFSYDCSCPAARKFSGPCKHSIALALDFNRNAALYEGFSQMRHVTTSAAVSAFLERATRAPKARIASQSEPAAQVRVVPRLLRDNDLFFGLRLEGTRGAYVVRDLGQFECSVTEGAYFEYGKRLGFSHVLEAFAEPDRELVRFVCRCVRNRRSYAGNRLYGRTYATSSTALSVGKELRLSQPETDELLELLVGRTVSYESAQGSQALATSEPRVTDGDPQLGVEIKAAGDDAFELVRKAPADVFATAEHVYALQGGCLYRCSDRLLPVAAFLQQVYCSQASELLMTGEDARRFCLAALPTIERAMPVAVPPELDALRPDPLRLRFTLDRMGDLVTCDAMAHYGARQVRLFDRAQGDETLWRDLAAEAEARMVVSRYFTTARESGRLVSRPDADAVARIVFEGVPELERLGEVRVTDDFAQVARRRRPRVRMGVRSRSGLIDLSVSADDLPLSELHAVLSSYRQRKRYYQLRDGSFVDLEAVDLGEASRLADELGLSASELASGEVTVPSYKAFLLDALMSDEEKDASFEECLEDFRSVDAEAYEPPASLAGRLRPYQTAGFRWLSALADMGFGGVLADEMGLGKSVQVISLLLARRGRGQTLIVCPASLVYNWVAEFQKFAPQMDVAAVAGDAKDRRRVRDERWHEVLITSYDLLRRDIEDYAGVRLWCVVLDEAQYIKNHQTLAARAVKALDARHRLALTGTPVENRLSELWSIFDFLMPGLLGGYERFRERYELPIGEGDDDAAATLRAAIGPFILRRLKADVLDDLPEKLEETRFARFDTDQQHAYDGQVVRIRAMLDGESEETFRQNKLLILKELTRIRQICCDPSLLFEGYQGGSAKREACLELIRSAIEGEHRMLVFSQFTSMLALLQEDLEREGIPYYLITGATPKQERLRLVKAFNEGTVPVFLISLKAGGTGLNLTGADVVIHYDPWWNAAAQDQATDRAHRIGQEKRVTVYKLIAKDTIEEKICELQEKKHDLAEAILTGESISIGQMTKEELLELLS